MNDEVLQWLLGLGVAAVSAIWVALIAGGRAVFTWMKSQAERDRAEREADREERKAWRSTIDAHTEESRHITRALDRLGDKEEQEAAMLKELASDMRNHNQRSE